MGAPPAPGYGPPPPGYGPPPYGYGYGYGYGPPPPPPRAPDPSIHLHDGFYFRASLGFGSLTVESDTRSARDPALGELSQSRGGASLDLLFGGTPMTGFVIGGGALVNSSDSRGLRDSSTISVSLSTIGPFMDAYLDPRSGFHVGALVGLSQLELAHDDPQVDGTVRETPSGWGGFAWVGYEGWIGEQWSLGGLARFGFFRVSSSAESYDADLSGRALSLSVTIAYH